MSCVRFVPLASLSLPMIRQMSNPAGNFFRAFASHGRRHASSTAAFATTRPPIGPAHPPTRRWYWRGRVNAGTAPPTISAGKPSAPGSGGAARPRGPSPGRWERSGVGASSADVGAPFGRLARDGPRALRFWCKQPRRPRGTRLHARTAGRLQWCVVWQMGPAAASCCSFRSLRRKRSRLRISSRSLPRCWRHGPPNSRI
jgi:hypothetical protein